MAHQLRVVLVCAALLELTSSNLVQSGLPPFMSAENGGCTDIGTCDVDNPVVDCKSEFCEGATEAEDCAPWEAEGRYDPRGSKWPLYLSYVVGALMAFGIGGNDSANSLATSVGSGAISLQSAVIMGAVGEWLGASFLGAGVSSTIRKGVADIGSPDCWACGYCNSQMDEYQFGMISALFGAAFFLLMVTLFSFPVSTTHAVVGGVVGMTVAGVGWNCLNFSVTNGLGKIALGWVVSPLVSGMIGSFMYILTYYGIMKRSNPKDMALCLLPAMYGLTVSVIVLLILIKSKPTKGIPDEIKYLSGAISFVVVTVAVHFLVVPSVRRSIEESEQQLTTEAGEPGLARSGSGTSRTSMIFEPLTNATAEVKRNSASRNALELGGPASVRASKSDNSVPQFADGLQLFTQASPNKQQLLAKMAFKNLLVMTAFLECFGHGANDTANATGPLTAVQFAYEEGIYACGAKSSPFWLLSAAGVFVGLGVITMGYRVIQAIGSDLADIDFHVGFCVEFASACAVVIATILGIPVSTTHCQVGAVVFVAATAYGSGSVSWSMFGKIAITWIATLPAAGGVAWLVSSLMYGF